MMQWYANQVTNHPSLVILLVMAVAGTCIIVSLTTEQLPSFKDPLLGFEPRGTELAQRVVAWRNLLDSSSWIGPLTMFPLKNGEGKSVKKNLTQSADLRDRIEVEVEDNKTEEETGEHGHSSAWSVLQKDEQMEQKLGPAWQDSRREQSDNELLKPLPPPPKPESGRFFCNDPGSAYAHVIFQSDTGEDLFTPKSLHSICRLQEEKLLAPPAYSLLCEYDARKQCCRSWSLPNYIALLRGRPGCLNITSEDVESVLGLLKSCAWYYHSLKMNHDCSADPFLCRGVPRRCTKHNAVYHILHFLTDTDFLNADNSSRLTYTSVFLPIAQSTATMEYYKDLRDMVLSDGTTSVVAMQLGLKHALFDEYLIHDTIYVALAGGVVFVFIWMYTTSFFVTLMTILAVVFSLAIAYFMYVTVFKITFFPFMNLLTVVIATGIGADDAFIYCKLWVCAKAEKNNGTLVKLVRDTLHHACLSMFVTSITTAVAFFGSFISSITAVRCFSIFAGITVLANFVFTVTCLPASVIIAEKWCSSTCCLCIPPFGIYLPPFQRFKCCTSLCNSLWKMHYSFIDSARVFFEKILPCIIIKPRYFWLLLFTALSVSAAVAVFYYPKLRLPDSKDFQIFSASHPFERYDLFLKKQFWFQKAKEKDTYHRLPIRVVWGIQPVDNGNYLNPFDKGHLVYDSEFNMALPRSQTWLLSFCKQLRNQSFYQLTLGPLLPNCFIETFKSWMERRCVDGVTQTDRTPCCETSKFPYQEEVFNLCIREAISILYRTPGYYFIPGVAGPRFSSDTGQIKAVVIEYDSVYTYSNSYTEMNEFRHAVDTWVKSSMESAPPGMRNGWFCSDLEFYDLQDSLARGTLIAIGVAIAVSFVALLATTLNLLISMYAIVTIACIIIVTVGSLVLLGWKLNILESITVSVAIGLAVDFTLHYGVAYRLSAQEDRESSVIYSLSRIGSPVAMGAFTTFIAGALIFPSAVLAYLQIGTFLVLVMAVSWIYSTFFFQSLLSLAGPQKGQLQLQYPAVHCCETMAIPVDKTAYALSESTLSTSSASYPAPIPSNETHELEPLTIIKSSGRGGEGMKYAKKKHAPRALRQRSGSFSAPNCDPGFSFCAGRRSRKVSLPIVNVTFHGDPSPQHVFGGNSSLAIVAAEEEKEAISTISREDSWAKDDAKV